MNSGLDELRRARRESLGLFWAAFAFSVVVNILMLTGPLYMLQVYDRVLGSRSRETLLALSILVAGLFLGMGILDHARARVMTLIGARFQDRLDRRVFAAALKRSAVAPTDPAALAAQRDLEAIQRLLASPVLIALFDVPWTPMFIAAIFVLHPWLGWVAVGGGLFLILVTLLNQWATRTPQRLATGASLRSERLSEQLKSEAELLQALGMTEAGFDRWSVARRETLRQAIRASGLGGLFGAVSKTFRMFLQSAVLGVGALLVLQGEMTGGAMIAGSILMGRALAPIEVAVGQWAVVQRAAEGWKRLAELLGKVPEPSPTIRLPRPKGHLHVEQLTVVPPGESVATLRLLNFSVEPGQAVGVIGPSGAGKTCLARALSGVWKPSGGVIRLDGATLDQYDPTILGRMIGYLPQRVTLFEGTIAENIARLDRNADSDKIVEAARKAAAHDMIVRLPEGYETRISGIGGRLSGGQLQRIGLARALYGDPVVVILDEPNSNLDNDGSLALNLAIRELKAQGKCVFIMAHRPAAIQECDLLLVIEDGIRKAFGPRDAVLREVVRNHTDIIRTANAGGVA
ncbi:type I secretion system permease/ATPase [Tabrizicola sp. J26]|uniref:type I secretion system permease/ATPase n=1 Tax=Alitabrizicola rongguiensis TaxID=2909234 RepID=UPI001F36190C|nr:type I secretion system permease/ATPase [Tabrizicola rongguiensis]MCF1708596.1 type I secretion system permease/ATPase [Tabrizicola rongguiensis]